MNTTERIPKHLGRDPQSSGYQNDRSPMVPGTGLMPARNHGSYPLGLPLDVLSGVRLGDPGRRLLGLSREVEGGGKGEGKQGSDGSFHGIRSNTVPGEKVAGFLPISVCDVSKERRGCGVEERYWLFVGCNTLDACDNEEKMRELPSLPMKPTQHVFRSTSRSVLAALYSVIAVGALSSSATASNWYVATNGNDSWVGSESQPFATIQKGINSATNGDAVVVGSGTYNYRQHYPLNFYGRKINLVSINGPMQTILDLSTNQGLLVQSNENLSTVVDGFSFINGYVQSGDDWRGQGIVTIEGGSGVTLKNCIFRNNYTRATYVTTTMGVIYKRDPQWSTQVSVITNCLFYSNNIGGGGWTSVGGGGSVVIGSADLQCLNLMNCTVASNTLFSCFTNATYGGGVRVPVQATTVDSSIVFGNSPTHYPPGNWSSSHFTGASIDAVSSANYTLSQNGFITASGVGNVTNNPLFINPSNGDFSLAQDSPARNSGNPAFQSNLDGSRADMGFRLSLANDYNTAILPSAPRTKTDIFGSGTNQFGIDFVTIGNPGNTNDTTGFGGVSYTYQMGVYDISQKQIDMAKVNGLLGMPSGDWVGDQPATRINWYQAAAFVNWLNTSQGYTPAYNLTYNNGQYSMALWPTNLAWTNGGTNLYRNANCIYFLPSEDEWHKAAYYDPNKNGGSGGYWLYPTGSSNVPVPVNSGTNAGTAIYNGNATNPATAQNPASVFRTGGLSPYGTMGQGGNVLKWLESDYFGHNSDPNAPRVCGGSAWYNQAITLKSEYRPLNYTVGGANFVGFRVARVDDSWLTNGLVAYYPLEGDFKDYSGLGNNLTNVTGSLGTNRFGQTNASLSMTTTSGATSINRLGISGKSSRTISLWFYVTTSPGGPTGRLIQWGSGTYGYQSLYYHPYPSVLFNNSSLVNIQWDAGWAGTGVQSTLASLTGEWHHVAMTYNGVNAVFYIDGIIQTNQFNNSVSSVNTADTPLILGAPDSATDGSGGRGVTGNLDSVRIYNRALSSNEVGYLYALEGGEISSIPTPTPQTISFPLIAPVIYGVPPFPLTASASSGLPVSFSSSSTNIRIAGSTVTVLGTGTATIEASQAGDGSYAAATPITNNLVVNGPGIGLKTQTITFSALKAKCWTNAPFALTAKAKSGLPITYTSSDSTVATVSNGILTPVGVGTTTITAYQGGNTIYNPATPISQLQLITQAGQKIAFPAIASHTYGDASFSLAATSSSGLPITYSSSVSNVATVLGNVVTVVGAGSAKITATQAGNGLYTAAAPVTQTLKVAKANQTVTFNPSTPLNYTNGGIINFNGTASSGLTLSYASSKPKVITIVNGLPQGLMQGRGTTTITATQAGNSNYNKASAANSITLQ